MIHILFFIAIAVEALFYISLFRGSSKRAHILFISQLLLTNGPAILMFTALRSVILDPLWMGAFTWFMLVFITATVIKITIGLWFGLRLLIRLFNSRLQLRWMKCAGVSFASLALLAIAYGTIWGRTELRVEQVEIVSDQIPENFDGYRVALFSDAHIGNFGGWTELVEDLVEEINEQHPDIVIQCGDLVNMHSGELTREFIDEFEDIKAPVYSVIGNHDLAYYIKDTAAVSPTKSRYEVEQIQKQMGWNILNNTGEWIYRGGDSILIGGVSFPSNHHHNGFRSDAGTSNVRAIMDSTKAEDFTIVAAHSPSLFDSVYVDSPRPDLILSGHTHSMQTKIEIGERKWSPAKLLYPKFSGHYVDGENHLYINDGLGYVVIPFRFGARPELTIITLKKR